MGPPWDARAPIALSHDQTEEVKQSPDLKALKRDCGRAKAAIYQARHRTIQEAEGTKSYQQANCDIAKTCQKLTRERLEQSVRQFHNTIGTVEINRQFRGERLLPIPVKVTLKLQRGLELQRCLV